MTTPQDPWQQGGYQRYPQSGPSPNVPSTGGQPQQPQQSSYRGGFPVYPASGAQPGAGGFSAAPPISAQEANGPHRPATVESAFWIAVVVPLLATVLFAVEFFLFDSGLRAEFDTPYSEAHEVTSGVTLTMMSVGVFIFAVLTTLWIVFGFKMRAGRDWARITLTVLAGFWLIYALTSLFSASLSSIVSAPSPALIVVSWTWPILSLVTMLLFVVLIYLKPSNWFFKAHRFR